MKAPRSVPGKVEGRKDIFAPMCDAALLRGNLRATGVRFDLAFVARSLPVGDFFAQASACPFRKLYPAILMMQPAQYIARNDASTALDGAAAGSIFLQTEMGARGVVVGGV